MAHIQKVVVKSLPEEPNITITLNVAGKQRNLERPKDEILEKPLLRLQKAAAPKLDKKQQKQQVANSTPTPFTVFVGLHDGPTIDHPLLDPHSTLNAAAWLTGRLLRIGDAAYAVELNPPSVHSIDLHGTPFVGIPLAPKVDFHFADSASWKWFKRPATRSTTQQIKGKQKLEEERGKEGTESWQVIAGAINPQYTPTAADEGMLLCLECTPLRGELSGQPVRSLEVGPVQIPPSPASGFGRHQYTAHPTSSPSVRVVSYNILADQYASTDTAREVLFPYCPPECLDPLYRRPLVLQEILGYNADVVCLQEVDDKAFNLHLLPNLQAAGYEGVYTNKAGKVREGSATFWKKDRYQLVQQSDLTLKTLFPATPGGEAKYAGAFSEMLNTSPALMHALQRVGTVAQLLLLEPISPSTNIDINGQNEESRAVEALERPLCIANTHLFFHYAAPHIRTMHVWAILQEAQAFINQWQEQQEQLDSNKRSQQRPAFVFCGDFNSDLNDGIPGAIELLQHGVVGDDHWDWAFGVNFSWGKAARGAEEGQETEDESESEAGEVSKMVHTEIEGKHPTSPRSQAEIVPGVSLASPFRLSSADGLRSEFTNYVKGYQGLLDYIWYEPEAMEVVQYVPLPSLQQLGGYLPSRNYPSDHMAVITDLRFKASSSTAAGPDGLASSSTTIKPSGTSSTGNGDGTGGGSTTSNVLPAAFYNVGAAVSHLRAGGVIAVPTDTIYGLAASASSSKGVERIYTIKKRSAHKPLAVCVADLEDVGRYGDIQHLDDRLLEDLLPGPVTLLLHKRSDAPLASELNPGSELIGIRIPDHMFLRAICRQHRGAMALTSANISGDQSSLEVGEFEALWPQCDAVYDGGKIPAGRSGSTIIDLTVAGQYRIARRGSGFAECMEKLQNKYGLKHVL